MGKRSRESKGPSASAEGTPSAAPMSAFAIRKARAEAEAQAAKASSSQSTPAPAAPPLKSASTIVLNAIPTKSPAATSHAESSSSSRPKKSKRSSAAASPAVGEPRESPAPRSSSRQSVEKEEVSRGPESALQRRFRAQQEAARAAAAALVAPVKDKDVDGDESEDEDKMSIDDEEVAIQTQPSSMHRSRFSSVATPPTPSSATTTTTTTSTPPAVSTFTPTASNTTHVPGDSTIFKLRSRDTLVIQGEYTLRVLSGTINIYGATLTPESGTHVVYAPITHALPVIEAVKNEKRRKEGDGFDADILVGCSYSGLKDVGMICPMFGKIWKPLGVDAGDDTYYPIYKAPSQSSIPALLTISKPWKKLLTKFTTTQPPPPPPAHPATSSSHHPSSSPSPSPPPHRSHPTIILTGSKATGKSTFSRLLLNTLLTTNPQVGYLDLDPGQPEFSPPGLITLSLHTSPILGPPFTHPSGPWIRAHHIGYITPREDPGHYIACIRDLLQSYHDLFPATNTTQKQPPLIINMSGYIKGTGMEILADVLGLSHPTDLLLLSHDEAQFSATPNLSLQHLHSQHQKLSNPSSSSLVVSIPALLATVSPSTRFHTAPTPVKYVHVKDTAGGVPSGANSVPVATAPAPSSFTPADLRALQFSCYFHMVCGGNGAGHTLAGKSNAKSTSMAKGKPTMLAKQWVFTTGPLPSQPPYTFPHAPHAVRAVHVLQGDDIPTPHLPAAIVGLLVGVVLTNTGDDVPEVEPCVALAVVRYYDPPGEEEDEAGTFQLILPPATDPDTWFSAPEAQALRLVRGRLDVPAWEVVVPRVNGAEVPWLEFYADGKAGRGMVGGREWRVRRNVMRRGQVGRAGGR